ncbi:S66 peptidase family protein [Candidatus Ulvibacter alkanivorans]|uniref:S66 peptidase family protein n=1 Tax=Candidatus Ulvibacter alkanivorans TaxID=2267620 RepID=UPI000DF2300F|nr:LD-carboxypeptidase [Candidatus Ulvibacter alkanivorans]
MITPPYLKKGDTVAIVSTARKIAKQELEPALDLLKEWGLNVVLGETVAASDRQFAGNDEMRIKDFQQALDDSSIKAIWCARGGYGTVRIIDALDFSNFKQYPKWIVGYSDITVLHSHIHSFGIATLHAQMPLEIEKKSEATVSTLKQALFGKLQPITFASEEKLNRTGTAQGALIGGNLSILYSLCGSASAIQTHGKILFLEDLDEYLYHVDRMMQNLKRNGMLEHLAGMVVGGLSDMNDNTIPFGKTAEMIVAEAVSEYDFPLCFHFPAGHVTDNRALVFGNEVRLEVSDRRIELNFL